MITSGSVSASNITASGNAVVQCAGSLALGSSVPSYSKGATGTYVGGAGLASFPMQFILLSLSLSFLAKFHTRAALLLVPGAKSSSFLKACAFLDNFVDAPSCVHPSLSCFQFFFLFPFYLHRSVASPSFSPPPVCVSQSFHSLTHTHSLILFSLTHTHSLPHSVTLKVSLTLTHTLSLSLFSLFFILCRLVSHFFSSFFLFSVVFDFPRLSLSLLSQFPRKI